MDYKEIEIEGMKEILKDKEKEIKRLKGLLKEHVTSYDVHFDELIEENKKLKEDNRFLTKVCKEYMEKENIIEVSEFTGLYKDELEEENRKLKEELKIWKLTAKDYAKQCGVELDDNLNI